MHSGYPADKGSLRFAHILGKCSQRGRSGNGQIHPISYSQGHGVASLARPFLYNLQLFGFQLQLLTDMHNRYDRRISREATMKLRIVQIAGLTAAAVLGTALLAAPALADGMNKKRALAEPPPAPRACSLSANIGLTTEYIFRGYSQTAEGAAVQGGFDATCGLFYAGVWASNLDWGNNGGGTTANNAASIEMDWYAGIKPKTGRITWDLGVIYYTYPNGSTPAVSTLPASNDPNYIEIKVGGSAEVWKDGTFGVTVFYSPEYQYETGATWTVEGSFSQGLPKMGMFTPTFSALVGFQSNEENTAQYRAAFGNGDNQYVYWNAGVTFAFLEKWSIDVRYWDTNLGDNAGGSAWCTGTLFQCDSRVVGTLKFTF